MVFTGEMDQITRHECEEKAKAAGAKVPWQTEGASKKAKVKLMKSTFASRFLYLRVCFPTRFKAMSLATCSTLSQTPWFEFSCPSSLVFFCAPAANKVGSKLDDGRAVEETVK